MDKESDIQALKNIRNRLNNDVMSIIDLITSEFMSGKQDSKFAKGHVPHWGLLRMSIPIAESIGALLYDNESTVQNLTDIFENNLSSYNLNYKNLANILIMLYRHPLIHSDEIRSIKTSGYHIGWSLDITNPMKHLKVIKFKEQEGRFNIHFDTEEFIHDLNSLLDSLIVRAGNNEWEGKLGERYIKWTNIDLDDSEQTRKLHIGKSVSKKIRTEEVPMLEDLSKDTSYPD